MKYLKKSFDYLLNNEFSFLFIALFSFIFIPEIFFAQRKAYLLTNILLLTVFASSIYAIYNTKRHLYQGLLMGVLATLVSSIDVIFDIDNKTFTHLMSILFFLFFTYVAYHIIRRVVKETTVTINIIFGSIAGYLLIGLLGALLCVNLYTINPNSFTGIEDFNTIRVISNFIYYSFVTLSTLGYGDIAPLTREAKAIAIFLSIFGQFYMTILVAIIVGKYLKD